MSKVGISTAAGPHPKGLMPQVNPGEQALPQAGRARADSKADLHRVKAAKGLNDTDAEIDASDALTEVPQAKDQEVLAAVWDAQWTNATCSAPAAGVPVAVLPAHTSVGESSAGAANTGWGMLSIVGLVGGAVAVAALTQKKDKPSSTPAGEFAGEVSAGPVIDGNGLTVHLYKADGVTLLGQQKLGADGTFRIAVGDYRGAVIVRVTDDNQATDDYRDEATGELRNLGTTVLLAVGEAKTGAVALNINPVTTIAARQAGLDEAGLGVVTLASALVANSNVSSAFGLSGDVTQIKPDLTNDGTPGANLLGQVMAALSGADASNGGGMRSTLDQFAQLLTGNTLPAALQAQLLQGALTAQALQPGTNAGLADAITRQLVNASAPLLTVSDNVPGVAAGVVEFTFTFTQAVTGFDVGKVKVTGGVQGVLTPTSGENAGKVFTLLVTPNANSKGNISITISDMTGVVNSTDGQTQAVAPAGAYVQAYDTVGVDDPGSIGAITGVLTQGEVLTAGEITDPDGGVTGIQYQWQADGVDIVGATANAYTLTQAEVGKVITVLATYTDDHGPNKRVNSSATGVVQNADDPGTIGEIAGVLAQGELLTAGTISDVDGGVMDIAYQWRADGVNISGATGNTFALTQAEVGKVMTVVATYTDAHGPGKSVTSAASTVVQNVDDPGSMAAISGVLVHGQVLTAGAITDADGGVTGLTYQWQANGVNINGATGSTYALTHAEVGKAITVVATYTDGFGPGRSVASAATAAVSIKNSYSSAELADAYQRAVALAATADDQSFYKTIMDQAIQGKESVSNDGSANGINALSAYINRVTGTDVVSDAEFDTGFSITGKTSAGATGVKFYLDNDRTNGVNDMGAALVHGSNGVSITHNVETGEYTLQFAANSAALKQATRGTAGSGVHKLTVDTDGDGLQEAGEASRLFLVASGTAQNTHTGLATQNFSVQDTVSKQVFVYFYGDVDGNGVGMWTQQDPTGAAQDRDNGYGYGATFGDWDYYNTPGGGATGAPFPETTVDNTALAYVTQSQAQTWEFSIASLATGRNWAQANGDAGNHSFWGSNTSRMASLEEILALYAANFSAGNRTTPGALAPVTDASAYNQEVNNTPAGWSNNFWTSALTPSGHAFVYFNSGEIYDKSATGLADVATIL